MLFAPTQAQAQTTVSGPLAGNQTWTPAGNPYLLTGDVTIPSGVTLTIEAGVNVLVADTDDQAFEGELTRASS